MSERRYTDEELAEKIEPGWDESEPYQADAAHTERLAYARPRARELEKHYRSLLSPKALEQDSTGRGPALVGPYDGAIMDALDALRRIFAIPEDQSPEEES